MTLSDAVFHLVYMQQMAEQDAENARAKAKQNVRGSRDRYALMAANHDANARALGVALAALVDLPA